MCDDLKSNPFAGLFSTNNDAVSFSSQHHAIASNESCNTDRTKLSLDTIEDKCENTTESVILSDKVDELLAEVFGLTLRQDKFAQRCLVFIDADSIGNAVFERLMLSNPRSVLTYYDNDKYAKDIDSHILETEVITYLYECYCRLKRYQTDSCLEDTKRNACQIVLRNVNTFLEEPDLFQNQKV